MNFKYVLRKYKIDSYLKKAMKKLIQTILICFLFTNLYSQNEFIKSFDSYDHSIHGMCKINSSTYALTGPENDSAFGDWDFILIKADTNGNIIFSKKFIDTLFWDESYDILSVSDGGFLVTVYSDTIGGFTAIRRFPEIVRIDSFGNPMWSKKFITNKDSRLSSSIECKNGDFVFGGEQDGIFGTEAIIIRINHFGDTLWSEKIGSPGYGSERINDLIETDDNNLLVIGLTEIGVGSGDIFVAKYNVAGDTLWTRTYGTAGSDYGVSVIQASDGSFYLSGFTNFNPTGTPTGNFIIKIDSIGSIIWSTMIGTNHKFRSYKILELPNKDLLLSGQVATNDGGQSDGLLAITDSLGVFKSAASYGGSAYEELRDVILINDSTCIAAGNIIHQSISHSNAFLIKQNTNNLHSCFGSNILLNDTLVTFQEGHGLSIYSNSFRVVQKYFATVNMPLVDSTLCSNISLNNFELTPMYDEILIYPNPFTSQTSLLFFKEMKNISVKIIDILGKVIMEINFTGKQLIIEKGTMKEGIYFLQIVNENKSIVNRKIIIQ